MPKRKGMGKKSGCGGEEDTMGGGDCLNGVTMSDKALLWGIGWLVFWNGKESHRHR